MPAVTHVPNLATDTTLKEIDSMSLKGRMPGAQPQLTLYEVLVTLIKLLSQFPSL
jgi:hypothetical protein